MRLVVEGLPNKLIADQLDISVRTVEVHRARVFDKMEGQVRGGAGQFDAAVARPHLCFPPLTCRGREGGLDLMLSRRTRAT
jgi:hypothetical protein